MRTAQRTIPRRCALLPAVLFLFTAAGPLAPVAAQAPAQQRALTPLDVARIQAVTTVAISPDGRYVAYTVAVQADPLTENATPTAQLHLLDRTTGATRALHTATSVGAVAFRPRHQSVTFLATVPGAGPRALYEVPVAGGEPARLWGFDRAIQSYAWAPDGARIAFVAMQRVEAPASPLPYRPDFFEENVPHRVGYVVDVTGGAPRPIQQPGSYYLLEWSPTGDRLAVSVTPTPSVDDSYMAQGVKVVDATTLAVVANIDNAGKLAQIRWSPDGRNLALRAGHDIHDPIDGRIMVVPAAGGAPRNILPAFEGKFESIEWTGANEIHFLASESTRSVFGRIRPDGTRFERLASREGLALTGFSRATAGHVAFVGTDRRHPGEVFVLEPRQREPRRMTTHNPWLAGVALGEQRVVRYTARDGAFDIDGLLILPVGYREGTRVPLITVVHGGPESHYLDGWLTAHSLPGQVAAGRGYAAFYPNYRGSTGRGLAFIMSSQADPAGKEFDDVVDGVDWLIRQGIVDSARVGVTGGSYGGYATAWMSTFYSDRFAAGVMNVGVANMISSWGTGDIPNELFLVHAREWPWENWELNLERSPIFHAGNARTPLLIMHGAGDTRVHPGQSLEMYRHLVVRHPELPVRLILYPGEGHGVARSASRLDYNIRMMQWFDAFLKGDRRMPPLELEVPAAPAAAGL
jgi:dipeptidyl aminopeptidase/acylaminoacyl peptidase